MDENLKTPNKTFLYPRGREDLVDRLGQLTGMNDELIRSIIDETVASIGCANCILTIRETASTHIRLTCETIITTENNVILIPLEQVI